jgi:lipoprotein-anchoring transpeptidase ErfK/SrfK
MNHKKWIVGILFAAVLLCAAGIAVVAEAQPAPTQPSGPARLREYVVQGEIVAATAGEATVETKDAMSVTLRLGDGTHYWVPGSPPTSTLALQVGDPVLAFGQPVDAEESGGVQTVDARVVIVVEPDNIPRYVVAGRVLVVTAETIVVRTPRGERAVRVVSDTRLLSPQGRLDSLRDIHRGNRLIALGQPTELGQWIAGVVFALP